MTDPAIKSDAKLNSDAADRLFLLAAKLETMRGMVAYAGRGELEDYIELCIAIARGVRPLEKG